MNEHVEPHTAAVLNGFFQAAADPLQAARAEDWAAVQLAEAQDPRLLRALRDQQQYLQSQGALS